MTHEVQAVHARQHDVKDNERRLFALDERQPGRSVERGQYLKTLLLQIALNDATNLRVILDNDD